MHFSDVQALYTKNVLPTYGRQEVCFVRGEGVTLWDTEGKAYLDFGSGIGVNSVGYAHPQWVETVTQQASKLCHVSNLYYTEPGGVLAERLCTLTGLEQVFFANSGAEANEGMIKLARKYSMDKYKNPARHVIVTLNRSFHGRTHTTLAATGQAVFHAHFQPLTPGFIHVSAGDWDALAALGEDICAVMVEPIQGEGGVLPLEDAALQALSQLCRERDWLLLCDEVQTGFGRTGDWFGFQQSGIQPDALSFAKGIAGGLPMGGFLVGKKAPGVLTAGLHATTFGGNPLCCAAALATLDIIEKELPTISQRGQTLRQALEQAELPALKEVRGRGLMLGLSVAGNPQEIQQQLLAAGLVCLTAGADALRLLPPLIVTEADIHKALGILQSVLSNL